MAHALFEGGRRKPSPAGRSTVATSGARDLLGRPPSFVARRFDPDLKAVGGSPFGGRGPAGSVRPGRGWENWRGIARGSRDARNGGGSRTGVVPARRSAGRAR